MTSAPHPTQPAKPTGPPSPANPSQEHLSAIPPKPPDQVFRVRATITTSFEFYVQSPHKERARLVAAMLLNERKVGPVSQTKPIIHDIHKVPALPVNAQANSDGHAAAQPFNPNQPTQK